MGGDLSWGILNGFNTPWAPLTSSVGSWSTLSVFNKCFLPLEAPLPELGQSEERGAFPANVSRQHLLQQCDGCLGMPVPQRSRGWILCEAGGPAVLSSCCFTWKPQGASCWGMQDRTLPACLCRCCTV